MIIKLTKEEEENLIFSEVNNRQLSVEYLKERDESWEEMVIQGSDKGKKFWNGKLYSIEGFSQTDLNNPVIYFGEMEYKDRLFKKKIGEEELIKRFGKENLLLHCGVSVVITTKDKKIVVGKKRMSVGLEKSVLSHVSGNLNKDELHVKDIKDLYSYILKEMEEEINIEIKKERLKFNQINLFNSYCGFDFVYESKLTAKEVSGIPSSEEFISLEALDIDEVLNSQEKCISDFQFSKRYLKELL